MRLDRVLTGKYTAIPIFLGIMFLIFWLTFGVIGTWLSDLLSLGIDAVTSLVDRGLTAYGINPWCTASSSTACLRAWAACSASCPLS